MALGGTRLEVVQLMLLGAMTPAVTGVFIGIAATAAMTHNSGFNESVAMRMTEM